MAFAGCNGGLTVTPFVGTVVQMTFAGSGPTAAGTHLEVWARDSFNDIIRVDASYTFPDPKDKSKTQTVYTKGLQIRNAITFDDPCMIDGKGNLLTSPAAYTTRTVGGNTETPEEQAQTVMNRIAQVTATAIGGKQPSTVLAVTPYDETPEPQIDAMASAHDRLVACQGYWAASPLAYTPNPAQLTAPLHGTSYGFVAYTTTSPPAGYDGVRLDSPTKLKDAQDFWLSLESVAVRDVDPNNQGPIYLEGKPSPGGNDVIHFDLTGPSASGTATLLVNLDDESDVF
jgi:hypothetical protein